MKQLKQDILSGSFFIVFGALLRIFRDKMITGKIVTEAHGPLTFPTLIAYGLMLCGALLVVTSWKRYKAMKTEAISNGTYDANEYKFMTPAEYIKKEWKVLVFMSMSVIYVLLLRRVGYFIVSFVASTLILLMMKARKKSYYIAVYAVIIVLYLAFGLGLQVWLPMGSWFGF